MSSALAPTPTSENVKAQLRIALRVPEEPAAALGVGVDFFNDHIRHELRSCGVALRWPSVWECHSTTKMSRRERSYNSQRKEASAR